jgi:hypothetical protein
MVNLLRLILCHIPKKGAMCLVFIGLLTSGARAQGFLAPIITPPVVLPAVLSLGGAVTNGGSLVITATVTTLTTLKGLAWYCGSQPVPPAKSTVSNISVVGVGWVSTLTMTGVALTNAGSYTLHATNLVGSTVSTPAIVLVANLVNIVTTVVTNVVDFVAGSTGMTTNGFKIQLSGPTGSNVVVQASSDFKTWTSISTNLVSGGNASFTDTSAKTRPLRYYRAFIQ